MIRIDRLKLASLMALLMTLALNGIIVPGCYGQAVAVASIGGQVADSTGAVVPNAEVTATQTATHFVRTATSDAQGHYVLSNLPVGPYILQVKVEGFKTYEQKNILLEVGNNVQINAAMEVGAVTERMEVSATASMVETKENAVAQVINQQQINDLPLNGRQATQLILISGASAATPADSIFSTKNHPSSVTLSIAGGQANSTNYLLDGGSNTQTFTNLNLPFPFPDALQEFSVGTSSLPARNGSHPGGLVNVVTKSGTNQLHGDLFEYLRNGDLNARNYFAAKHDGLKRNQFGGTVGDRIIRDKLFFFAGYQGTRTHTAPPQSIAYVPTTAALSGDFSTLTGAGCQSTGKAKPLTDPVTGTPFPNNQIPVSRYDKAAIKIAGYLPPAQNGCGKVTYGIPTVNNYDDIIGRVDYIRSSQHSLFARYFVNDFNNPAFWNPNNVMWTANVGQFMRSQSFTLGDTYTLTASTVNSFHATFTRMRNNRGPSDQQLSPAKVGINTFSAVPNDLRVTVSSYFSVGCGTCSPGHFNTNTFHFSDDVDMVKGRHQLAFGADFMRSQNNLESGNYQNGQYAFNGAFTTDALADYFLGDMSTFEQNVPQQNGLRQSMPALYVQDTFHASSRLTVNAGVRWEPLIMPTSYFTWRGAIFDKQAFMNNQHSKVDPTAPAGMFFYGDPGVTSAFAPNHWKDFAPRVGLVFNPHGDGRDTIRVGAGLLYDTAMMYYGQHLSSNPPYAQDIVQSTPAAPLSNPWAAYPGGDPFPTNGKLFPPYATFAFLASDMKPTYMAQWNVTYQRQLVHNWMASVSYIGSKTTHMWLEQDINPSYYIPGLCAGKACSTTANENQRRVLSVANPTQGQYYGQILQGDPAGNAFYHGLLASVQHRFSQGFSFLANYTWSHCSDDDDFVGQINNSQYQNPDSRRSERGDCNFDYRQVFNSSIVALTPTGSSVVRRLTGNWQIAPLIRAITGSPLTVSTGKDISLIGNSPVTDRPNVVLPNAIYNTDIGSSLQWLNPSAFASNATGAFGNVGRDSVRGPSALNFDVSLSRTFKLAESKNIEARIEGFNVINHTRLGSPNLTFTSSTFGQITTASDPRILQLAMKYHF